MFQDQASVIRIVSKRRFDIAAEQVTQRGGWLGWLDSNQRYTLPKSVALPTWLHPIDPSDTSLGDTAHLW